MGCPLSMNWIKIEIKILLIILVAAILFSCKEKLTDSPIGNRPPETKLFLFPDSTIAQQLSKLNVSWWGDDPDGLVVGYYFSWDGVNWSFTTKNDSTFTLKIGANDTTFSFSVAAVDNYGNSKYDDSIVRGNLNLGPEPFIDQNNNGKYDSGEPYYDIGAIDETPATQAFPIKNSPPTLEWSELSTLPDTSFPVMTFGWISDDIDGIETIKQINIALNDTNNSVAIDGAISLVTIRTDQFDSAEPEMDIYINGDHNNPASVKIPGLKFNDNNVIYIQAEDISGAKSPFIQLPDTSAHWFVKKPKGNLLVIDDYITSDNSSSFYSEKFDSLDNGNLKGKYDVWNLHEFTIPYESITFLETIKLFDAIYWYSDNEPNLELASVSIQNYLNAGGKAALSFQLPRFVDQDQLRSFLPIDSTDSKFVTSVIGGAEVAQDSNITGYPNLKTQLPLFIMRTFYPSSSSADVIYHLISPQISGNDVIGFKSKDNKLFFIGIPLNKAEGYPGNVVKLLNKVLFEDFGLLP